jgi:hypothetical protein
MPQGTKGAVPTTETCDAMGIRRPHCVGCGLGFVSSRGDLDIFADTNESAAMVCHFRVSALPHSRRVHRMFCKVTSPPVHGGHHGREGTTFSGPGVKFVNEGSCLGASVLRVLARMHIGRVREYVLSRNGIWYAGAAERCVSGAWIRSIVR